MNAVIVAALRTPIARADPERGAFRHVRADDLAANLVRELIRRTNIPPRQIEDVIWGCVRQQGEQGGDLARRIALLAGLPITVPGVTVQRYCGSGLEALVQAARAIAVGEGEVMIAGGVEHMHHLPIDADSCGNPRLALRTSPDTHRMGLTAEFLARQERISRHSQDEFAAESHRRAAAAAFADEIVPTLGLTTDQGIRPDTTVEVLAKLPPAFVPGGTVTAGNASQLSVGAAALMLMSSESARELGMTPLARVRAAAVVGVEPALMGLGPVPAVHKLLRRARMAFTDVDLWEVNEAFAVQALAVIRHLGLNPERVNVNGGAVAVGHPLGASGARITVTLLHEMRRRGATTGVATLCIGGGQGIAVLCERD